MTDDRDQHLEHAALRPDLDMATILGRFWNEVRTLKPKSEIHVVDPYLLSAGNRHPQVHADNVVALVKPLLKDISRVTCVYRNELPGVRQALARSLTLLSPPGTLVRFVKPARFHHRWVVADRSRLALMDVSFNQVGDTLGGVNVVTQEQDRAEYCAVLNKQDPLSSR